MGQRITFFPSPPMPKLEFISSTTLHWTTELICSQKNPPREFSFSLKKPTERPHLAARQSATEVEQDGRCCCCWPQEGQPNSHKKSRLLCRLFRSHTWQPTFPFFVLPVLIAPPLQPPKLLFRLNRWR